MSNVSYLCKNKKSPQLNLWALIILIAGIGLILFAHIAQSFYPGLITQIYLWIIEIISVIVIIIGILYYIIKPVKC